MNPIRILAVGDVVKPDSADALCRNLWSLRKEYGADLCIVNGENAAEGNGIDVATAKNLFQSGTDVITSGNHIWRKREIYSYLNTETHLLRPANYPAETPGSGYCITNARGYRVLVVNLLGNVYMDAVDCPFARLERILAREEGNYDLAVLDIHAEATSEKAAIARYFDGRVGVVFGTHTHVQTADARVLPKGTGFITDIGMTGHDDSILGIKSECIINQFRTRMPQHFEVGSGAIRMTGAYFDYDLDCRVCTNVTPVDRILS